MATNSGSQSARTMSTNAKILLIAGIVITVLSLIGVVYQWMVYQEVTGGRTVENSIVPSVSGSVGGARGGFMQAIVSWNGSKSAIASKALEMLTFMCFGVAVGVFLIWLGVREARKPMPASTYEELEPGETRRRYYRDYEDEDRDDDRF